MRSLSGNGRPRSGVVVVLAAAAVAAVVGADAWGAGRAPLSAAIEPPTAATAAPRISGFTVDNMTCDYLVDESTDRCYLDWTAIAVTASSNQYIIDLKVAVDGDIRLVSNGFFQTWMQIPSDMLGSGLEVVCGAPGEGGFDDLGRSYAVTAVARETGGGETSAGITITCPVGTRIFADGFESHDTSAWSATHP